MKSPYKKLTIDKRTDHCMYVDSTDKKGNTLTIYIDSSTGENIINVYDKNHKSFFSYYLGKKEKDKLKRENKKLKKKLKRAVVFPKSKLSVAEKTLLKDNPNNV